MKKKLAVWIACFIMACIMLPVMAHADVVPEPSLSINLNLGDEVCYGILISQQECRGQFMYFDGERGYRNCDTAGPDIMQAFADYKDEDGYNILNWGWKYSPMMNLEWLWPPSSFKILLYFPETDTYAISGIYECKDLESFFIIRRDDFGLEPEVEEEYDPTRKLVSFFCRMILTILLELAIAWLFRLRQKKLIAVIAGVNVVTQVGLNLALYTIDYIHGKAFLVFSYVILEILVFIVEAAAYMLLFRKNSVTPISGKRTVFYALAANTVSVIGGIVIARFIPGIF